MSKKESILGIKNYNFPIIEISILIIIAISLRLVFLNNEIPLVLDSLTYFSFAHETKILGELPNPIPFTNTGWPILLSFFFTTFSFENAIDYMNLQRLITIIISAITVVPIYLLCNKFVEKKYAIIASSLFIFDPRIIQNSILGITDTIYIFLMTFVFVLFFNSNKKLCYTSFILAAIITFVRAEGIFVFIAISILFLMNFRKEKKILLKYLFGLGMFLLILSPIIIDRVEGFQDEFTINSDLENVDMKSNSQSFTNYIWNGTENFIKMLGWVTIPIYIIFLIPGFFLMIKKYRNQTFQIIIPMIIMSIPIFYAYSIPAQDTRYLFVLFPFFSIIAAFFIKSFNVRIKKIGKSLPMILVIVIIVSSIFLFIKTDFMHEKESYMISKYLVENVHGVNKIYPEGAFVRSTEVLEIFPNIPFKDNIGEYTHKMKIFDIKQENLYEFIDEYKDQGLTHIITDENFNRNKILIDIFRSEESYPFLEKVMDTNNLGWEHHFKIFRINYDNLKK